MTINLFNFNYINNCKKAIYIEIREKLIKN